MHTSGLGERVLMLAFSVFGRRAAKDNSGGTDHDVAGPAFVAGPKLVQGIHGPASQLADLDEGEVKMASDVGRIATDRRKTARRLWKDGWRGGMLAVYR